MEEQRPPGYLDVEGEASNQPVRSISVPGLRPRDWSRWNARWALMGTAAALLLMAVVLLGFGNTKVPRSAVTSHTTAFTAGFLAPSIQTHPLTMHRPKLVTLSSSNVVESRTRFELQMKPDGTVPDSFFNLSRQIEEGYRRGLPTLTAEDEEWLSEEWTKSYLAAITNGDFNPSIGHQQDPREHSPAPSQPSGSKPVGFKAQAQKAIDRGEAATLEEAVSLMASRASKARFAKYTAEEISEMCRKANLKAVQNLMDSGKATTLKEAQTLLASNAANAMAQQFVTNGEATTLKEAWSLKAAQLHEARLAKFGEMGLSKLGILTAQNQAIREGKYANYPGVHKRKETQRWRVQFTYRGKRISVPGSFDDELDAAMAHDAYVKEHGLIRPLHFPENDAQHVGGMPIETSIA